MSPGVLAEGEPLEAFDIFRFPLGEDDPYYEAKVKQRNAMIPRLDEKKFWTGEDRGFGYIEKVDNGLRYFTLKGKREQLIPSPLRWFLVPAIALFAAAIGCGMITMKWK